MRSFVTASLLLATTAAFAADPQTPASQRYDKADQSETPDFQKHVMPLLGKLGCNGRACHGSFQGRGGFRLSLFGYDPAADHAALTKTQTASGTTLVNLEKPSESPFLTVPVDADGHEGGKRFELNSWEQHLIAAWIKGGAPATPQLKQLKQLEVQPAEIVSTGGSKAVTQLRAIAHWEDGSTEDVTCLSRFQTNNESIVEVDHNGQTKIVGKGDTHVVAFYDNGVTPVPVVVPVSDKVGDKYPQLVNRTPIDGLIAEKLRKLGIIPSEVTSDAEFLRRISLDVIGTLPKPDEVEAFLADSAADKRAKKIDELLDRPEYAAWWATKFSDLTGNNPRQQSEQNFRSEQARQWYDWLHRRLKENAPYDELVAGLLTAVGRPDGVSYDAYITEMSAYYRKTDPTDFSARKDVPHYWSRSSFRTAEDRVVGISYAFLGLRIQCAQCHKHPFDQWTKTDFEQFANFFKGVQYGLNRDARDVHEQMLKDLDLKGKNGNEQRKVFAELAKKGEKIPLREVFVTPAAPTKRPNSKDAQPNPQSTAKLLGAESIDLTQTKDPRLAVMDWLRRPENPYFARAMVNRLWAHYFGTGIIEPADDLNLANPPSNRELLDHLAHEFVAHKFDLKWLHREILNSDAYQRSWKPNETNQLDHRHFSRAWPRRLPAEVTYDAVVQATASPARMTKLIADPTSRAIGHASVTNGANAYAMRVFGKPERMQTCDCERSNEPTLLQSVYLLNDQDLLTAIESGGWTVEAARRLGEGKGAKPMSDEVLLTETEAVIREAYERTVSRPPSAHELADCREHLSSSTSKAEGLRDLLWALLNTKEFVVNH